MARSLKVYLVGRPSFDANSFERFLADEQVDWRRTKTATSPEELVELSGRTCYMSFGARQSPRTNAEFVENLVRMGHESVLEHVSWTFLLTGISRAFTHQLVRHRVGFAFSQLSQQYHDETDAEFIIPSHLQELPGGKEAWERAIMAAKEAYGSIIAALRQNGFDSENGLTEKEVRRAIRSAARSVLPNATETKIVMTANARALRHFLRVRGAIPGDAEMRQVAAELLRIVKSEAPALFFDFEITKLADGSPTIKHSSCTTHSAKK